MISHESCREVYIAETSRPLELHPFPDLPIFSPYKPKAKGNQKMNFNFNSLIPGKPCIPQSPHFPHNHGPSGPCPGPFRPRRRRCRGHHHNPHHHCGPRPWVRPDLVPGLVHSTRSATSGRNPSVEPVAPSEAGSAVTRTGPRGTRWSAARKSWSSSTPSPESATRWSPPRNSAMR